MGTTAHPPEFVKALERGLAVISAFDENSPSLTMTEVARKTGMTKAAARRFLLTLVGLGYASYDGRGYLLRPRALEIGGSYLASIRLPVLATPHLEKLAATVRETASLTVLDGADVVYVARVQGHRIMSVSIQVGTRFPALLTSTGRAMISSRADDDLVRMVQKHPPPPATARTLVDPEQIMREIQRVRKQGYAVADRELDPQLRSIAVPVRSPRDEVVAAVNVSTHTSRASVADLRRESLPPLRHAALAIEAEIAQKLGDDLPLGLLVPSRMDE